jgi:hypothetical protein
MNCVFNKWSPAAVVAVALISLAVATDANAQTVATDGEGSALRAPTAAEAKALAPAAAMTATTAAAAAAAAAATAPERRIGMVTGQVNPVPIVHSDGTVQQELDASTMSYTVARANADGSISMVCVTGEQAAQKALKGKNSRVKVVASKGHSHDTK